jgi:hypothetical protein
VVHRYLRVVKRSVRWHVSLLSSGLIPGTLTSCGFYFVFITARDVPGYWLLDRHRKEKGISDPAHFLAAFRLAVSFLSFLFRGQAFKEKKKEENAHSLRY